jgi:hypothetical protein
VAVPQDVAALGVNLFKRCFAYPEHAASRKHGPQGYAHYEAYRDWLRDEFDFRCAYCLMRESWLRGSRGFQIDHCSPRRLDPTRESEYDNLTYTCPWCNQSKAGVPVPNPTDVAYGMALQVTENGVVEAKNSLGAILIDGLRLNHAEITHQRRLVIRVVRLAEEKNNAAVVFRLLGYPDDLPNLRAKRPPGGNRRPEGVRDSCLERRRRGELALIY